MTEAPLGETREYDFTRMTDWAIGYEGSLFSPEKVEELERRLLADGVERDD